MIVIDGTQSNVALNDFENLSQAFEQVMEDGYLADRIVTDVYVDGEPFTEIYPHQAEDISTTDVKKVEITSVATQEMAVDMTLELYKVVNLMSEGGDRVAQMFRQADDAEALETYLDLLDVTRGFVNMVGTLRNEFALQEDGDFASSSEEFNTLFTEMMEVLENEDWILLADLLEYEFKPAVERWKKVIAQLRDDIRAFGKE